MVSDENIKKAIESGKNQAKEIISFRDEQMLRGRRKIIEERDLTVAHIARPEVLNLVNPRVHSFTELEQSDFSDFLKVGTLRLTGSRDREIILAEGDSWFDYPGTDVLRVLEDIHHYDVESVAYKGDLAEDIAYNSGQLEKFARLIEKILRRRNESELRAVLISCGGNDMLGPEVAILVNHILSPIAGLNDSVIEGVINQRLRLGYITILSKVTEICKARLGRPLPIILHGYDYPVPDGRGYRLFGLLRLAGPWIKPSLEKKGFVRLQERIALAKELVDIFNEMIMDVVSLPDFNHVHYIDLRNTLSVSDDYKKYWADELHPTEKGFEAIAELFNKKISSL